MLRDRFTEALKDAMPLEKVRKVLKIAKEPISLETPIGDEENSHLGDFIEDRNAVLPIDAAVQSNLRESTTRALASLTPREERVLRMGCQAGAECRAAPRGAPFFDTYVTWATSPGFKRSRTATVRWESMVTA